jgi:allantoinase
VQPYPRDLIGYGANPPHARWPGGARLALSLVLNYEEGGENAVLHGDPASEAFLNEIVGGPAYEGMRHMSAESVFEYGSPRRSKRRMRRQKPARLPITIYGVAMALQRNPEAVAAMVAARHEIACHGLRWVSYQYFDEATERGHLYEAVQIIERMTGAPPLGWYTGRDSPNTRRLVVEHGGFLYDSDSYADDLPYWVEVTGKAHLVIPYTLDANDMRFSTYQGFNSGDQFYAYLRDTFDVLYAEGNERPKMMSVGLHCRLAGRPGRFAALQRFLDHVEAHDDVWICRRVDIARHWHAMHPADAKA